MTLTRKIADRMGSTGPRWSLYPILSIIAFIEFLFGGVHVLFCSPFYFLFLHFINSAFGLVAAFHAIFLRFPNRCDFYLQLTCSIISIITFSCSLFETYCIGEFSYTEETIKNGVCHGLKYRTIGLVESCNDFLGNVQLTLMAKLGWQPQDKESILFFVSASLTVLCGIHLAICVLLTFYSALETKIRLYSFHYQVILSIVTIILSFVHWRYCCTFFFLLLPPAIGTFGIIQGVVSWRSRCHGSTSRAFNVIGAALSVTLFAVNAFGIFCWLNRHSQPEMMTRHCVWQKERVDYCVRVIHFTHPYIDWLPTETDIEIAAIQIIVHLLLLISVSLHFGFSMKSAFSTKNAYLYY